MTSTLLFAARLCLVLVFGIAARAKILDRAGYRGALTEFGVPRFALGLFAVGLPVVELVLAAALFPAPTARPAAVAALALLFLFTVAMTLTLARGRRPPCHCFGQRDSTPISWRTVGRNVLLMLLAGVVVWRGLDSGVGRLAAVTTGESLVAIGVVVALAYLAFDIRAGTGATDSPSPPGTGAPPSTAGLPIGHRAPDFGLPDLNGETQTLRSLLAPGKTLLLAFAEPGCDLCDHLLPDLARWQRDLAPRTTLALLSAGSSAENRSRPAALLLENVLLQANREVADAYLVKYSPAVVLVLPDGTIGAPAAVGQQEIERLVQRLK